MPRSSAETREHVLGVAHELFYWHGIRATGVDRVASAAGVAPTTLYRLFTSKDDLVAAYIERADRLYREWFDASAAVGGPDPRDHWPAGDPLAGRPAPDCSRISCRWSWRACTHPPRRSARAGRPGTRGPSPRRCST